jgi:hypothetical protein
MRAGGVVAGVLPSLHRGTAVRAQVPVPAVEQFPLDGFAGLHSDDGSQRNGKS